jgi:hypothetical protein
LVVEPLFRLGTCSFLPLSFRDSAMPPASPATAAPPAIAGTLAFDANRAIVWFLPDPLLLAVEREREAPPLLAALEFDDLDERPLVPLEERVRVDRRCEPFDRLDREPFEVVRREALLARVPLAFLLLAGAIPRLLSMRIPVPGNYPRLARANRRRRGLTTAAIGYPPSMSTIVVIAIIVVAVILVVAVALALRRRAEERRRQRERVANEAAGHRQEAEAHASKARELNTDVERHQRAAREHEGAAERHAREAERHAAEAGETSERISREGRAAARHDEEAAQREEQLR